VYNYKCKQRGEQKIHHPQTGGYIKMIIVNGELYYFNGYEYVNAEMTEEEFFNQMQEAK